MVTGKADMQMEGGWSVHANDERVASCQQVGHSQQAASAGTVSSRSVTVSRSVTFSRSNSQQVGHSQQIECNFAVSESFLLVRMAVSCACEWCICKVRMYDAALSCALVIVVVRL